MTDAEFSQFVTRTLTGQLQAQHPRSVRKVGQHYGDLLDISILRLAVKELVLELKQQLKKRKMTHAEIATLTIRRCSRKAREVWDLYLSDPDNPNQVITRTE